VDPARLDRTAYARLVRKGLGDVRTAPSLELEGRVRSALASEGRPCSGVGAGTSLALRALTLQARLGACWSGFSKGGLTATTEAWDLEVGATHAWDLRGVSVEVGMLVGGAVLRQTFRTGGVAPPRTSTALQLSPVATISHDLGARSYLFASAAAATYLYRLERSTDGTTSVEPSFALRFAAGCGWRL
jgi:hypothetical protein